MQRLLIITFLFYRLPAQGQADSLARAIAYNVSPAGKPAGEKTIKAIGPNGGRIASADGTVELIIPPGALTTITDISVRPLENTALAGIGPSFDFGPDGLQFKVPAELIFHYADSDSKETPALFQNIVWQDGQGQWHHLEKLRLDSLHKTLSGAISHFTGYTRQPAMYINPASRELIADDSWPFTVVTGSQLPDRYKGMSGDKLLNAEQGEENIWWFVNGVEKGSDEYGHTTFSAGNGRWSVDYAAPDIVPDVNPVTLEARVGGPFTLANGAVVSQLSAYAKVTIVDEYHYTFIGYSTMGHLHMIDSASCDIKLGGAKGGAITVDNVTNHPAWSDWPEHMDKCFYWYTNKDSWKGLVNMVGAASITSESRPADHSLHLYIGLKPSAGNTPSARMKCKDGWKNLPSNVFPAQPTYIDLTIRSGTVQISYAGKTGSGVLNAVSNNEGFIIRAMRKRPGIY